MKTPRCAGMWLVGTGGDGGANGAPLLVAGTCQRAVSVLQADCAVVGTRLVGTAPKFDALVVDEKWNMRARECKYGRACITHAAGGQDVGLVALHVPDKVVRRGIGGNSVDYSAARVGGGHEVRSYLMCASGQGDALYSEEAVHNFDVLCFENSKAVAMA